MSELESLCHALQGTVRPLPGFVVDLQRRATRLRSLAAEVQQAAARVQNGPDVSRIVGALSEAAAAIATSAESLLLAVHQSNAFVARTIGGGGGSAVPSGAATTGTEGLSQADREALADYTGTGFLDMNASLRGIQPTSSGVAARVSALSAALAKLPDYTGVSYRGTYLTPEQAARYVPGSFVTEHGFTSTSSSESGAFVGNTFFYVQSKHGKTVTAYSSCPHESEVLFDRGTRFYVVSHDTDASGARRIFLMEV